tara:strand:- start:1175 stop:1753 length:579 start_codon:yes stop_codon:yes gene_type:complete
VLFPTKFRSGDTINWTLNSTTDNYGNPISSPDWVVTYYLRTNKSKQGISVTGVADGDDFKFTMTDTITSTMLDGNWFYQAVATKSGNTPTTISQGEFKVLESMQFSGSNPKAFDGRTDTERTLDLIKKAIDDVLKNGAVQEYKIGTRTAKKYTLAELTQLRIEYQSLVNLEKNEQSMANGQGSYRKVLLRFK